MKDRRFWLAAAVSAAALAAGFVIGYGCKKGPGVAESEVVASVNDAILTAADVDRLDREQRKIRQPSYLTKREIMEDWVRGEVIYQHALDIGLDKEQECAWRLHNTEKAIIGQRFWEVNVYEKYPEATEADALKWYEENKEKEYEAKDTGVWLRRILLNTPEKAAEVLAKARAGEDFGALAEAYSVTPEKLSGGTRGYRRLKDISPAYRDAVAKMKDGDIGGPYRLNRYYVIIKCEDVVAPGEYLKPEGIGLSQLQDRAKIAHWRAEAARLGKELESQAKIKRYPERLPETAVDMALGETGAASENKDKR